MDVPTPGNFKRCCLLEEKTDTAFPKCEMSFLAITSPIPSAFNNANMWRNSSLFKGKKIRISIYKDLLKKMFSEMDLTGSFFYICFNETLQLY